MSRFADVDPMSTTSCERYADELIMLDEPGQETPDRIAARTHLAGCTRCQNERQAMLMSAAALHSRVQSLMAQAPTFTEAGIAARAALQLRDGATMRKTSRRRQGSNFQPRFGLMPMEGRPIPPFTATSSSPYWRRALSTVGSVVAIVLITILLVATLTGHLLGRASTVHQKATAAVPLSAFKVYAPALQRAIGDPPGLVAYRASDGAPEDSTPGAPVAEAGIVFAQGVRYELTMPNANMSGPFATIPAILSATRLNSGQSLWREQIDPMYTPSLTFVDGVLYLGTQVGVAGIDPRIKAVYAYRASDGALLWSHTLRDQLDGPPIVSAGVVYVVAGETALALRADNGVPLWQASLQTGGQQIVSAWPTVASGALYIYTSLVSPSGQKDSFGVDVFALRLSDGGSRWRVELGADVFPADGPFAPVVAGGVVYVRLASMTFTSPAITLSLFALNAADGAVVWRYTSMHVETGNTGIPNIYPPAVSTDVVYVTEDGGNLTALSARDGHTVWQVNVDTTPGSDSFPFSITSPLAVDGAVFVIVNGWVVAVRASDGGTLWRASGVSVSAPMNYLAYHLVVGP